MGPTSLISLLTGEVIDEVGALVHQLLTFFAGAVLLIFSFFPVEPILKLVPLTVTTGFASAAAILIISNQLKYLFGIPKIPRGFVKLYKTLFTHLDKTNVFDLTSGMISLIFLLTIQFLNPAVKRCLQQRRQSKLIKIVSVIWTGIVTMRAILVIVASATAAYFLTQQCMTSKRVPNCYGTYKNRTLLTLTGPVPHGLPEFEVPPFGGMEIPIEIPEDDDEQIVNVTLGNSTEILPQTDPEFLDFTVIMRMIAMPIFVIPMVSMIETLAIGRTMGQRGGYSIDASQEMFTLGVAQVIGSFFNAYPSAASLSRSAMNSQCKVKTQFTSFVCSAVVLIATATVADICLPFVPKSCLAAVVIAAAMNMIEIHRVIEVAKVNPIDLLAISITFFTSLLVNIEIGIIAGILASLIITALLSMKSIETNIQVHTEQIKDLDYYYATLPKGELRYPCAESIKNLWNQTASFVGPMVIECYNLREVDFETIQALINIAKKSPNPKYEEAVNYPCFFVGLQGILLIKFQKAVNVLKITQPDYRNIYFISDMNEIDPILEKQTSKKDELTTI